MHEQLATVLTPSLLIANDVDTTQRCSMGNGGDTVPESCPLDDMQQLIHCIVRQCTVHTCSATGAVVGLTIAFWTTAIRTGLGARVCSLAAPKR